MLHIRLLLLLLLHVGGLLLLLHCDLLLAAALVELVARLALLDGLGRLGADVDRADGLTVRVQRSARVLALVTRTDGVDLSQPAFIVSLLASQLHFRLNPPLQGRAKGQALGCVDGMLNVKFRHRHTQ